MNRNYKQLWCSSISQRFRFISVPAVLAVWNCLTADSLLHLSSNNKLPISGSYMLHTGARWPATAATNCNFEVEVTLRPTISRPVRHGVLPLLEYVTRCYIYLSDNFFLYFSCRAPSLTGERVCNFQCNDASSVSSYIATDGLSASSSWSRAPNGAHNQILISLFDSYFVFPVFPCPYPP
jgi:hypothetical protein